MERRRVAKVVVALALGVAAVKAIPSIGSIPGGLWVTVRVCAAVERWTGRPFPCLAVDLTEGKARGFVLLRPPWSNDLILSPTRPSVGVEDPFLLSAEAPNYFAAAWAVRDRIRTAEGGRPPRGRTALIVNPAAVRAQDQMHIHIGCLTGRATAILDRAAGSPVGVWRPVGDLLPGRPFWALRVRSADLSDVEPFQLAQDFLRPVLRDPADLMVAVVGLPEEDAFLVVASAAPLAREDNPPGAEALLDGRCRTETRPGGG